MKRVTIAWPWSFQLLTKNLDNAILSTDVRIGESSVSHQSGCETVGRHPQGPARFEISGETGLERISFSKPHQVAASRKG